MDPTLTEEERENDPIVPLATEILNVVRPSVMPPIVIDEMLPDAVQDEAELPDVAIVTAVPAMLAPPDSEKVIVPLLLTMDRAGFVSATDPRLTLAPDANDTL